MTTAMAIGAGQGEARWWLGGLAEIKATSEDTDGQLTIVQVTEPPGMETPLHVHYAEDEGFWILEGEVTLYVGDETIEAKAGGLRLVPAEHPAPLHGGPERLHDAVPVHAGRV